MEPSKLRPASLLIAALLPATAAASNLPDGFVYLRDVDASIVQDMRYAAFDNFTGRPLPGYDAPECVLRREVAEALQRMQADLAKQQIGLKVYDCYRPTRAVRVFVRWAQDGKDAGGREAPAKRFFPMLQKRNLFASGYIAAHSAHSTGSAVDLTLVRLPSPPAPPFDPAAAYGPCTAPAALRTPDSGIDMGTGFDCFDANSHTASAAISSDQQRWRAKLVAAMRAHGFQNYFREWWHFSYRAARRAPAYDFPIVPREGR